jgi:hypothetical protein
MCGNMAPYQAANQSTPNEGILPRNNALAVPMALCHRFGQK